MTDDEFQRTEEARFDRRSFISGGGLLMVYFAGWVALIIYWVTVRGCA